ncbi:hypothetical protein AB833_27890 [Chromatiales bacterium (ex Bugula neritina AB1)]|nr:hypothetical protein AB833_27890 [Chromatiales bacterium (ex Bugula neritina AB1)]
MIADGKTVLLTGGLGGIGRPLLQLLLAVDAEVTVVGRSCGDGNNAYRYIQADLGCAREVATLCDAVRQDTPDIVINLAGLNSMSEYRNQPASDINTILHVNLLAPMLLAQAALGVMTDRRSGQIVNVGSVLGSIPSPLMAAYSASKAGLQGFSQALGREVAGTGVKVTHINPRAVRTAMNGGRLGEFNRLTRVQEDSPETVALRIFDAMVLDKKLVNIGLPEKFYSLVNSVAPIFVDDVLIANRHIGENLLHNTTGEIA